MTPVGKRLAARVREPAPAGSLDAMRLDVGLQAFTPMPPTAKFQFPPDASPYPLIHPVPPGTSRPLWSVMIPTYNCAGLLAGTLRSVLAQGLPVEEMQIEVVDDCSSRDDPAAVVSAVGGDRVSFFRQPANVGPQANFTTCVQRARGHWVHILHGDDMVRPGFYDALRTAAERAPEIHAAFCRVITMDEQNGWLELAEREQPTAGIALDLIGRLAVYNIIMFPCMAVRRCAYEVLGGFHPQLFHAADWDMWKRIAARFPVWYEPEPLALYRIHAGSDTSRLMRTGANITDARRAIAIAESYLPVARADELSRKARLYHALYAIEIARECVSRGDWAAARAQVYEGLKCSASPKVLAAVLGLVFRRKAAEG
jgi:GT2 family glycosyltransferase